MILTGLILISLAGIAEGIMDKLQFHYDRSWFKGKNDNFWNPLVSWMNKYSNEHFIQRKPKFLGSTTIFVFVTDGWHLMKFCRNLFLWAGFGMMLCNNMWDVAYVVASRGLYGIMFTLIFKKL